MRFPALYLIDGFTVVAARFVEQVFFM